MKKEVLIKLHAENAAKDKDIRIYAIANIDATSPVLTQIKPTGITRTACGRIELGDKSPFEVATINDTHKAMLKRNGKVIPPKTKDLGKHYDNPHRR